MNPQILKKSIHLIKEADCVFIGAGAGITAAAGINFTDREAFAKHFPAWKKRGFEMQYQLMGYNNWTMAEQWGYYAVHLNYVYYGQEKNDVYQSLRKIVGNKPYFVMTSNVDGLFQKNNFEAAKVYEPQGSYGKIQCITPCNQKVWDMKPFYDKMRAALDPETQVLTDKDAIPKCPNCGEDMFIHARKDGSFIDAEHKDEVERLKEFMSQNQSKKILLLELGAGYNTPTVIRYPMEELYNKLPNTNFIRINLDDAEINSKKTDSSLAYQGDIALWINTVAKELVF